LIFTVIHESFIQNLRITPHFHIRYFLYSPLPPKLYLLISLFGTGFTGTSNSALNAGTAEPIWIAPAKPVAYNIE
jgi:hypothetical protein